MRAVLPTTQINRGRIELSSPLTKSTIVLADDNQAMLAEVSHFLQATFDVIATAPNGALAVQNVAELRPDLVILDIAMPVMGGLDAAREIKRLRLPTKIIFMTVQRDRDYIEMAIQMGASYVLKPRLKSDMLRAIDETLAGRQFISPLEP